MKEFYIPVGERNGVILVEGEVSRRTKAYANLWRWAHDEAMRLGRDRLGRRNHGRYEKIWAEIMQGAA
jgi:hypothetical protein